jgi:hypothetical protein
MKRFHNAPTRSDRRAARREHVEGSWSWHGRDDLAQPSSASVFDAGGASRLELSGASAGDALRCVGRVHLPACLHERQCCSRGGVVRASDSSSHDAGMTAIRYVRGRSALTVSHCVGRVHRVRSPCLRFTCGIHTAASTSQRDSHTWIVRARAVILCVARQLSQEGRFARGAESDAAGTEFDSALRANVVARLRHPEEEKRDAQDRANGEKPNDYEAEKLNQATRPGDFALEFNPISEVER